MALDAATVLRDALLALPTTDNQVTGVTALVDEIGDFMDKVQAGSTGTVGIFTLNRPIMVTGLLALTPTDTTAWIAPFSTAWENGVKNGVITPSTVTDATWLGSGNLDTITAPSPTATILTIAAAKAVLIAGLNTAAAESGSEFATAPLKFAEAISDATLAFQFTCIGLGAAPVFPPIPLVFSAE